MLLGWRFWEWPKVFLEAEFHAVWQLPDISLQDPTPNEWGEPKIRFVEIPQAIEPSDGGYPDNVLEPLNKENMVVELVEELRKRNLVRSHGSFAANLVSESKLRTLYEQVSKSYGAEPRLSEKMKIFEGSYR